MLKVSEADGKVVAIRRLLTKFQDQKASQRVELGQVQRITNDLEKGKQVALELELAHRRKAKATVGTPERDIEPKNAKWEIDRNAGDKIEASIKCWITKINDHEIHW